MKTCSKCGGEKPTEEFGKDRHTADGLERWCRSCRRAYQAKWRAENPDVVREQKRRHRESHREEVRAYKRARYWERVERERELNRVWHRTNRAGASPSEKEVWAIKRRWSQLLRDHGLSPDQFADLLERQDGRCGVCRRELPTRPLSRAEIQAGGLSVHVDHCHESLLVRGLLCVRCNQGLGIFQDDVDLLEAAKLYLLQAREPGASIMPSRGGSTGRPWDYTPQRLVRPQPGDLHQPHRRKTHCSRGHEYTEGTTYYTPQGHRRCRICMSERQREARERKPR